MKSYTLEFSIKAAGKVILNAKNPEHAAELLKKMPPVDLIRESSDVTAGEVAEMNYGDLVQYKWYIGHVHLWYIHCPPDRILFVPATTPWRALLAWMDHFKVDYSELPADGRICFVPGTENEGQVYELDDLAGSPLYEQKSLYQYLDLDFLL